MKTLPVISLFMKFDIMYSTTVTFDRFLLAYHNFDLVCFLMKISIPKTYSVQDF